MLKDFYVHHEYMDDDKWRLFYATSFSNAAEFYAEEFDNDGDHTLTKGDTTTVLVKDSDGVIKRFVLSAQTNTTYCSLEIKE